MTAGRTNAPSDDAAPPSIIECCQDEAIFGQWFRDPRTWRAWLAFLATLFGLPRPPDQAALVEQCTSRNELPSTQFVEAWLCCGRRAGKSFVLALVAVYLACFRSYAQYLGPNEKATIAIIATDRRQARAIYRFVVGLITGTPLLRPLLVGEPTMSALELGNNVVIEISVASFKTSRGYTYAAVLCDELAFWATGDAAEPDHAILDAVRPGLSTIPGAMLLCASSPYAKRGALYDAFKRYYGSNDPEVLVWKAPTRAMNPTIRQAVIDRAMEKDPASATSEYLAEFRTDVGAAFDRELIESLVDRGVVVREPMPGTRYCAHCDPSGGRADGMVLAISHRDNGTNRAVLDCILERRPPFDPIKVAAEFATVLRNYKLREVQGDHYSAGFIVAAFAAAGVTYRHSNLDTSATYGEVLGVFSSGRASLLDNARLVQQLASIERRTGAARDKCDHPAGMHDDLAAACCGALVLAASKPRVVTSGVSIIICGGTPRNIPGSSEFCGTSRVFDRMLKTAGPT